MPKPFVSARIAAGPAAVLLVLSITNVAADADEYTAYQSEHDSWRRDRITFLRGPDGYLNLAGLHWLKNGAQSFGSSSENDLVFPPAAAERIGRLELIDGVVRMTVEDSVAVQVDDQLTSMVFMSDDSTGAGVVATQGNIAWTVIRRDDRFAVRVRDFDSAALREFETPEFYPLNMNMRRRASFVAYDAPRIVQVDTVIEGLDYKPEAPGILRFDIESDTYELEAYSVGEKLFLIFADQTSGRGTYPAGRFLYTELPDDDGTTLLDFNKAYNPPCAYNEFATCPIASPRNRLRTRISAGERYHPTSH